jgi:quinol monooxygenase YgiN
MYRYIWKITLHSPDNTDAFVDYWRQSSSILQQYPGALGTHIHAVRGEPSSYFMVAEWESQESRDAMSFDIHNSNSALALEWRKLPNDESFGSVVRFAGEAFDQVGTT